MNELMIKGGELEAEMAQLGVQGNRRQQELAFALN